MERIASFSVDHLLLEPGVYVSRIDRESGREAFHACVENALRAMEESHISISCGISWRAERGNIDEQINEADKKMYLAKRDFYACKEHDCRHYWPEQE